MLDLIKNNNEINIKKYKNLNLDRNEILNTLIKYICIHIKNQINAGADVIQIFDSWAGLLPKKDIKKLCYIPNLKIVEFCKTQKIPVICFPKGLGKNFEIFNNIVQPDGISIDSDVSPHWAKEKLKNVVIQGGLDPKILLKSEEEIFDTATKYIKAFKGIPYVFNLGHGLLPETDPAKVNKLIEFYRNYDG